MLQKKKLFDVHTHQQTLRKLAIARQAHTDKMKEGGYVVGALTVLREDPDAPARRIKRIEGLKIYREAEPQSMNYKYSALVVVRK